MVFADQTVDPDMNDGFSTLLPSIPDTAAETTVKALDSLESSDTSTTMFNYSTYSPEGFNTNFSTKSYSSEVISSTLGKNLSVTPALTGSQTEVSSGKINMNESNMQSNTNNIYEQTPDDLQAMFAQDIDDRTVTEPLPTDMMGEADMIDTVEFSTEVSVSADEFISLSTESSLPSLINDTSTFETVPALIDETATVTTHDKIFDTDHQHSQNQEEPNIQKSKIDNQTATPPAVYDEQEESTVDRGSAVADTTSTKVLHEVEIYKSETGGSLTQISTTESDVTVPEIYDIVSSSPTTRTSVKPFEDDSMTHRNTIDMENVYISTTETVDQDTVSILKETRTDTSLSNTARDQVITSDVSSDESLLEAVEDAVNDITYSLTKNTNKQVEASLEHTNTSDIFTAQTKTDSIQADITTDPGTVSYDTNTINMLHTSAIPQDNTTLNSVSLESPVTQQPTVCQCNPLHVSVFHLPVGFHIYPGIS